MIDRMNNGILPGDGLDIYDHMKPEKAIIKKEEI